MEKGLIITADDYGLTRAITDDILTTIDAGAVTQASVLANGEALAYALAGYRERRQHMMLSAHLNLTEGKALSAMGTLQIITDEKGMFRYSVGGLWMRYVFASSHTRTRLRHEIAAELGKQWQTIQDGLVVPDSRVVRADGHQHVHMLPFVFDTVLALPGIKAVRISREPFYLASLAELPNLYHLGGSLLVRAFARRNRKISTHRCIVTEGAFLGLVYSGQMSPTAIEEGLKATGAASSLELALHPGTAGAGEFEVWRGSRADISWHYSPWREREREFLMGSRFSELIRAWRAGTLGPPHFTRIIRFAISGSIAAVIDLATLYILTSIAGIWYLYASILAFGISFAASFLLQKLWTFDNRSVGQVHHQAFFYLFVQLAGLAGGTLLLYLLVSGLGLWYLFAQFLVLLIRAIIVYAFSGFIFAHRPIS